MEIVEGYDHQPGRHCGAAALRNVTAYYDWNYSEPACFGIGGGPAFVLYEHPEKSWVTFRTSPTWLERAFFERLGVPHATGGGDDFDSAWVNATARVDDDDPVVLFLDPAPLGYLPEEPDHVPPHVAVLVGYDDESVQLSDAAVETRQTVSRETLREAWAHDRFLSLEHEYLAVSRARRGEDDTDAAAAGLRQAATYMVEPLEIKRDARGPGEEGISAMRSFAEYVGRWPDLPEPARPVRAARRSIHEHRDATAYRSLFSESLAELGQQTGLPTSLADRMDDVGRGWQRVGDHLGDVLERDEPGPEPFEEAASLVADVADREEAIFEDLDAELGGLRDRE